MSRARFALLLAVLLVPALCAGQALEQQVKAAFLFRFLSFVEWPARAGETRESPLVIAVLGADDVLAELRQIVAARVVRERPVLVERLAEGGRARDAHVLFVGRSAAAHLRPLAGLHNVLLVAEWEGALEQGAHINFLLHEHRVRFEVDAEAAERRGMRISARMLAVAFHVKGAPHRP